MRTCLVCDDHALVRDALASSLGLRWPDADIEQADSFPAAWTRAALGPDLCLVDLMMPGAGPVAGIRGVMDAAPDACILVVTGSQDDGLLVELLRMGVHGFVQKTSATGVILAAIELILAGGRYLPPRVAELAAGQADRGAAACVLTDRQCEVLRRIAGGESNKEIARALAVSPATIKTHVSYAISSLSAANRTEAAMRARALGLI